MPVKLLKQMLLREGIDHIEDLPLFEFMRTVQSINDKVVTEKLDGAQLWFGLDDKGLFTSREGKSSHRSRFYDVQDYPVIAAYNGFRGAHLALERVEPIIRKYLKVGDVVETEVLFGRQPNTVTYGVDDKNFIVVLRGIGTTPDERVANLANALNSKQVKVESSVVTSDDGDNLKVDDVMMTWEFTKVIPVSAEKINTTGTEKLLKQLQDYADQTSKMFPELTNGDLAELNLTSVSKDKRALAKSERERVNEYIMTKFKLPIKELLLGNFVRKVKPMLQSQQLHPSEDIGVEGVVIRDPVTGGQTKIVDKDVFTAINAFNSTVRSTISGLVRTADQDAPIESRGGVFGQAKIKIANILGNEDLALSSSARREISKHKKSDPTATAQALAASLPISSLSAVKTKVSSALKGAISEIDTILKKFKEEAGEYKLKLKTGKEIGISPEVMKRTLTAFAETKKEINDINSKVLASRTGADLVSALYGRTINSLFNQGGDVKESYELIKTVNVKEDGDGGTTTAGAIAANPQPVFQNNKVIQRRERKFKKAKKFAPPKFSLIKSVNEEWAHLSDMKFAADVDDSARGAADVEFNQLRNSVTMGDQVTATDVTNYLDKAHEINDQVDTVGYALETSDGKLVKVYVNANQATEFEKTMAQMLGKVDDVEIAIDTLANKFDIVDVEWPEGFVSSSGETVGEPTSEPPVDGEAPVGDDDTSPQIDVDLHDENGNVADDGEGAEGEAPAIDTNADSGEVTDDSGDADSETSDEESTDDEDDGQERDDFGQVIKKKKKAKKEKPVEDESSDDEESEDDDEDEEEKPTTESVLPSQPQTLIAEAEEVDQIHPSLRIVSEILASMGFDLNANRSFNYQARLLRQKNGLGLRAAKIAAVLSKLKLANDSYQTQLAALRAKEEDKQQGQQQLQQSFELIGSVVSEVGKEWATNTFGFKVGDRVLVPFTQGVFKNDKLLPGKIKSILPSYHGTHMIAIVKLDKPIKGHGDTFESALSTLKKEVKEEALVEGKWSIGDLGDLGVQISTRGIVIKIDDSEAEKLSLGLNEQKEVSVLGRDNKRYHFKPDSEGNYAVSREGDEKTIVLPKDDVAKILNLVSEKD